MRLLSAMLSLFEPATPVLPPQTARSWAASVGLVALLGVIVVALAALLAVLSARRRRNRARNALRAVARPPTPDPWTEAGRRLHAEDLPDDPPAQG